MSIIEDLVVEVCQKPQLSSVFDYVIPDGSAQKTNL
jgi:hypothetical protein